MFHAGLRWNADDENDGRAPVSCPLPFVVSLASVKRLVTVSIVPLASPLFLSPPLWLISGYYPVFLLLVLRFW